MKRYAAIKIKWVLFVTLSMLVSFGLIQADERPVYEYDVDLSDIVKDRYQVTLRCQSFSQDTLIFHFPYIIPGTYMEANYGKFIHKFQAFDSDNNPIKYKKDGRNTFIFTNGKELHSLKYWVSATWEGPTMRTIYPMAGTGIIPGRVFAINAGGVFGYFENHELAPVTMNYTYPTDLYAMTVLDQQISGPGKTTISTMDYHELIDSPIMFAYPDTTSFKVQGTDVLIGFAHETDDTRRAAELSDALEPSMDAIASYLDSLPAEKYAYLIYYADAHALGKILDNPRFLVIKGIYYLIKHGVPLGGALEHNNSSFYYLPDPGGSYTEDVSNTIEDIAIHEFMHILTPLNLRSEFITDWDYNQPLLSKHLWLYEGVTEYMSQIIQVNGGEKSVKDFLLGSMRSKLIRGEKFPFAEMSFTEMASNVLEKPHKKQYNQVYQRGAVIGMLLDIEIIRLTEGRKRLIDVMLELISEYGPGKPMDEEAIFDIFTEKVHPDLRDFFTRYVEGREALPYTEVLNVVGVTYEAEAEMQIPRHPIKDNKIKQASISIGSGSTIKKVSREDKIGFKKGDMISRKLYRNFYFDDFGDPLPEAMVVSIPVERDGEEVMLKDVIKYKDDTVKHHLSILKEMTPEQSLYFNIWLGFQEPIHSPLNGEAVEIPAPEE